MRKVWRIFFYAEGTRPFLVLACLLLAGAFEALSLSSVVPAAHQLAGGISGDASAINRIVVEALDSIGLEATLGTLMALAVAAMVVKSVLSFAAMSYAGYSVAVVSTRLRRRLLKALFAARWSYFSGLRGGRISNTISVNATRAGTAYLKSARCVAYALQAAVYIAVAFVISAKLTLAGIVFGALVVAALSSLIRLARKAGYKQTDRTAELVTYVADALANIKPIKTMHRQAHFLALFARRIKRLKRALVTQAVAREGLFYGQDVLSAVAIGIGVYVAAVFWNMPLPEITVLGLIFFQVVATLKKLLSHYQSVAELEAAYLRTLDEIEHLEAHAEAPGGGGAPSLDKGCRFDKVTFAHADTPVVRKAGFEIPAGAVTVLQGPSGAGKTTLIDLLLGLHRPDSGRVLVDGRPLETLDIAQWRRMIGYVPQELNLLHGSVLDNITLGDSSLGEADVEAALEQAGAAAFVAALPEGWHTDVGEMGARLSGGQRQRISLARALVTRPKLLILDEVTSALDPETEREICRKIRELAGPFTIVAITHRPAWTDIADRLYRVSAGRVSRMTKAEAKRQVHVA